MRSLFEKFSPTVKNMSEQSTSNLIYQSLPLQDAGLIKRFLQLSEDRRQRMSSADIQPEYRDLHAEVLKAIHDIYGLDRGMRFSKSIHPDGFSFFVALVEHIKDLKRPINFLEIGSFEGVSMSVIASLLRKNGVNGSFVSIDPYFDAGYLEDHPAAGSYTKDSTGETMSNALALYKNLNIPVEHLRVTSDIGLKSLLLAGRSFDLIYIDGLHNGITPTIDFGLSMILLAADGVIILDDWPWPDIIGLKAVCDKYLNQIVECPDIVAYQRR